MTLTDGVFAIAMTVLVLELSVPAAAELRRDSDLGSALIDMWPDFAIYGLSFLVLGMFWLMHHAIFDGVIRQDLPLQWLNIAFLMFAALIPFSTALFGEYDATSVTSVVYGANMLAVALCAWAMWHHAASGQRSVRPDLDPVLIRGPNLMGRAHMVALAIPIGLSFVAPVLSFVLYGLIVVGFFLATVTDLGKWPLCGDPAVTPEQPATTPDQPRTPYRARRIAMRIMGTNMWDFDAPADMLMQRALEFTEKVEANGIARLHEACIAPDQKLLWCTWDTDDLDGLQAAFDELNCQSGLKSTLTPVEVFYPS